MTHIAKILGWEEGPVDQRKEHFVLCYGSIHSSQEHWVNTAVVGSPVNGVLNVEIVLDSCFPGRHKIIFEALKDVQFLMFELQEENPWGYAQHHCLTFANAYSDIHWSFVRPEAPDPVPVLKGAIILEVEAEGGSIALLGNRDSEGDWWLFWLSTNETAMLDDIADAKSLGMHPQDVASSMADMEKGDATESMSQTIGEAIVLLDTYPWHALYPRYVRPEFREQIRDEVRWRGGELDQRRWDAYLIGSDA